MNTLNKTLLGILALQVVIFVAVTFSKEEPLKVRTQVLLPGREASAVDQITISGPAGAASESVTLARAEEGWQVASADGYPAKGEDVDELLETLQKLKSRTQVLDSSRYHDKLEVTDEAHQRKVTLRSKDAETTFFLGTAPSFKSTHFRLADADEVYLAPLASSDFGNRAWSWVERLYVDVPRKDIWSMSLVNESGRVQLTRDPETDAWSSPSSAGPLAVTTVNTLLDKARSLRLEEPVGRTLEPSFGFDAPLATVELTVGTSTSAGLPPPQTTTKTLLVGAKVDGKARHYVKSSDSAYVVEVQETAVKPLLEKTAEDLTKD